MTDTPVMSDFLVRKRGAYDALRSEVLDLSVENLSLRDIKLILDVTKKNSYEMLDRELVSAIQKMEQFIRRHA